MKWQSAFLIRVIRGYQTTAPYRVATCRFTPSCSEYMAQAIWHYGPVKGTWRGIKRICRCHPFHAGGYDPVPVPLDAPLETPAAPSETPASV